MPDKRIKMLDMIAADMKQDAEKWAVWAAECTRLFPYFGSQGAAIAALAKIVKPIVEDEE